MDSLKWKRRLGALLPPQRPGAAVLLYHSVNDAGWGVSEKRFREQLAWLRSHATVLPLERLCDDAAPADGLRVALTFDDGYATLHDRAAPLLEEYGMPATVFLNTGWISDGERRASSASHGHYPREWFMTWAEALSLTRSNWSLGSHGVDHVDLTRAPPERVADELRRSKQAIEQRTQAPCQLFAYPWGRTSAAVRRQVRDAGYRYAVCGAHGTLQVHGDPLSIPRIDIRAEYELRDFVAAVTGRWNFLSVKHRVLRAIA